MNEYKYKFKGTLHRQVKEKQSRYRPRGPRGFQEVKVHRFHDNGTGWW
jgi:hypothetical protein